MDRVAGNPLLAAWASGRRLFGMWCTVPGSMSAEMIARQGVDYVCLDYQHGLIDHVDAVPMMQAVEVGGSVPIARVGRNDAFDICRVLDAGARAVVVPMVEDAAEAERAALACRYPPLGHRSFGPARAAAVLGSMRPEDIANVACIVMVETATGVRNAAEIAAADGVDAVYLGPNDLALALGLPPARTPPDPKLEATITELLEVCHQAGVPAGIQATDGASALRYAQLGFDMVTLGTDIGLLTAAVRDHLRTSTSATPASPATEH